MSVCLWQSVLCLFVYLYIFSLTLCLCEKRQGQAGGEGSRRGGCEIVGGSWGGLGNSEMDPKIVQEVFLKLHKRYPEGLTIKEGFILWRRTDNLRIKGKGVRTFIPRI